MAELHPEHPAGKSDYGQAMIVLAAAGVPWLERCDLLHERQRQDPHGLADWARTYAVWRQATVGATSAAEAMGLPEHEAVWAVTVELEVLGEAA